MEADSRAALAQVPGITNVTVKWDSNVPRHQHTSDVGKNFRTTIAVASGKGGVGKSTGFGQSCHFAGKDGCASWFARCRYSRPQYPDDDGR